MRIYAAADIHGRPERIEQIRKAVAEAEPDVLVIAGDITHFVNPVPILEELNRMPVPVLAIRGNTDRARVEKLFDQYPNISPLHLREIKISGVPFAGASGTFPLPFLSKICLREGEIIKQLEPLVKPDTVLVVHPPPYGTLDEVLGKFHAGSRGIYRLVSKLQPAVVICGHIHERQGKAFIGRTLVANCSVGRAGAGFIIEQ